MKIQKITAAAQANNVASNKILTKIGMTQTEQYLENDILWNWYDMINPND